jgi:hypothetical protein
MKAPRESRRPAGTTRERALDAWGLVDRLLVDVVVGTRSLDIFESLNSKVAIRPAVYAGMRRMCHSQTLLGLAKFAEFYETYRGLIPADCRAPCKDTVKTFKRKRIHEFRSKYVAHLVDKETGRPLNLDQLERYVAGIYGQDEAGFVRWVHDQKNVFPTTVVSVLERTRDEIAKEHGISMGEMIRWGSE